MVQSMPAFFLSGLHPNLQSQNLPIFGIMENQTDKTMEN